MTRYHLVDGELFPDGETTVDVRDRGFRYGDAAFETMRVYDGHVFAWSAHMDRLARTCSLIHLPIELDRDELSTWVDRVLAANELTEAAVRLSITRGVQPGTLQPRATVDPCVVIVVRPLPRGGRAGPIWDGPATVRTSSVRKIPDEAIPAAAKTHNYLNGILARLDVGDDVDEALMRDTAGNVAEGTISNLFVVEGERLATPTTAGPVLAGITRRTVLDLADDLGIPTVETTISPTRLTGADEVFLTNTTWEVRPVATLDDQSFERWPVTERLAAAFADRIEAEFYD